MKNQSTSNTESSKDELLKQTHGIHFHRWWNAIIVSQAHIQLLYRKCTQTQTANKLTRAEYI